MASLLTPPNKGQFVLFLLGDLGACLGSGWETRCHEEHMTWLNPSLLAISFLLPALMPSLFLWASACSEGGCDRPGVSWACR